MSLFRKKQRVRFAPSPTGYLHLGGFRTALYNYLYAKKVGGDFILRIEDTDRARLVPGAQDKIIDVLENVGLEYDEGPTLIDGQIKEKGDYGPYTQSTRLEIYRTHAEQLLAKKKAYYCFCTTERLEALRQEQTAKKMPTIYDKKCAGLDKKEIDKLLADGASHVIRLDVPSSGETKFEDVVYGSVNFQNKLIDDQVLLKSDGFPTYHLANVVDDHLMKITTVIRGEEWLPSTPKHLILYQAFGWSPPKFVHLPLLLNQDKSKLSKRQGDVALEDYLAKGYLKEALINFIAFLGWNPGSEQEFFTLPELTKAFSLEKINKSGAVFNLEKLDWLNAHYIKKLSAEQFYDAAIGFLLKKYPEAEQFNKEYIIKVLDLEKERVSRLEEVGEETDFFFKDLTKYPADLLMWKGQSQEQTKKNLEAVKEVLTNWPEAMWQSGALERELKLWISSHGFKNGDVLWPLRVALTGREKSPPPFVVMDILGQQETLKRLNAAINKC